MCSELGLVLNVLGWHLTVKTPTCALQCCVGIDLTRAMKTDACTGKLGSGGLCALIEAQQKEATSVSLLCNNEQRGRLTTHSCMGRQVIATGEQGSKLS